MGSQDKLCFSDMHIQCLTAIGGAGQGILWEPAHMKQKLAELVNPKGGCSWGFCCWLSSCPTSCCRPINAAWSGGRVLPAEGTVQSLARRPEVHKAGSQQRQVLKWCAPLGD